MLKYSRIAQEYKQRFPQSHCVTFSVHNGRQTATNADDGRHFTRTTKQRPRLFAASSSTVPSGWLRLRARSSRQIIFFAQPSQASPGHSHEGISRSSRLALFLTLRTKCCRWHAGSRANTHARTHNTHPSHLAPDPGKPNCPTANLATLEDTDSGAGSRNSASHAVSKACFEETKWHDLSPHTSQERAVFVRVNGRSGAE